MTNEERDMSAHIPEGDAEGVERDMTAKTDDLGEGLHPTSATFGKVVSPHATDAAGHTPADIAAATESSAKPDEDDEDDDE